MVSICDVPGVSAVCEAIGPTTAAIVSAPCDWMGQAAAANTAQWLFQTVWSVIDATTLVDVTTPGYVKVYNILFGIGVFIMLIFFLQLGTGVIRRDPGALKHGLLGLARAVLGSFLVVGLVAALLQVTDELTIGLVNASGNTMATLGDKMSAD